MNGYELTRALSQTMRQADEALLRIVPTARRSAEAEARFRSAIKCNEVRLKADGMPATMIKDVARGMENACSAYVDSIVAEAERVAAHEELMLRKKEIGVLQDALNREWGASR